MVTAKLEQIAVEKRDLQTHCQKLQKDHQTRDDESEKVRIDSEKVVKERDNLRTESVRLKHRISYLEEQVFNKNIYSNTFEEKRLIIT